MHKVSQSRVGILSSFNALGETEASNIQSEIGKTEVEAEQDWSERVEQNPWCN